MSSARPDLDSKAHIKLLVDAFYAQVVEDSLIGPVFTQKAKVDWDQHLPTMYAFWEGILLGNHAYRGRPFPKHIPLGIEERHFDRWLGLFSETIDNNFKGPKAELAKFRAQSIAAIFSAKLQNILRTR